MTAIDPSTLANTAALAARLPNGFRLGTATSAYQIEGAWDADGKGPSIWDEFVRLPGRIRNGDTGDVAIDAYHRWSDDIALVKDLGVDDYRFSLAWPRIQPSGTGAAIPAGLDYVDRLVDTVLAAGLRPMPTLYHWDLPAALQATGGWLVRDTAEAFADYAGIVGERIADRVTHVTTVNEPNVHVLYGYGLADHAPGLGLGLGALAAAHHLLLGHGLAVAALRAAGVANVGIVVQHAPVSPASDSEGDRFAAAAFDDLLNGAFAGPLLAGAYPESILGILAMAGLDPTDDLATIAAPLDFYGVNYYEPTLIADPASGAGGDGVLEVDIPEGLPFVPVPYPAQEHTDFGWPIVPEGLYRVLTELRGRYPSMPPMIVTESGASFHDGPDPDGRVRDDRRIAFLAGHLDATVRAARDGAGVTGYYVWSAFDNFEWAAGYAERFGLVHVDFATQQRTPKDSYYWYQHLLASRGKG